MINPESDKSPLAHSNHFPCITALTQGKDKVGGGGGLNCLAVSDIVLWQPSILKVHVFTF